MDDSQIITIDPNLRNGETLHSWAAVTVYDVLEYLAGGMSESDILADFPELTGEDIKACIAFAADRERKLFVAPI